MSERSPIPTDKFTISPYVLLNKQWMLLAAGDLAGGHFNCMTIGWGFFGVMWSMPCAIVAVRPSRFTYEFMEKYPDFTLCAFPSAYHKALTLLGTVSGRDGDKIAESGLTPEPAAFVAAPVFAEAELAVECRRLYWEDLQPDKLTDPRARLSYPKPDYHRLYLGEMLAVTGTSAYHT